MGFASGSGYAQNTWDIVRDAIPEEKRAELALKFFRYYEKLDADDWDYSSNLLQDTGLDEFKLCSPKLTHLDRVKLASEFHQQGKRVHFNEDDQWQGVVKQIEVFEAKQIVEINWRKYTFEQINNGLITFEMD